MATSIEAAMEKKYGPKSQEYAAQLRSLCYNLKDPKNPQFRVRVLLGIYPADRLATMKAESMASDEKKLERDQIRKVELEACQSDWANRNGTQQVSGMFKCGRCGQNRTTYTQAQTRSADEPMTTFVPQRTKDEGVRIFGSSPHMGLLYLVLTSVISQRNCKGE